MKKVKMHILKEEGKQNITCPKCGHEQYHTVYWVVNCQKCAQEIHVHTSRVTFEAAQALSYK